MRSDLTRQPADPFGRPMGGVAAAAAAAAVG